MTNGDLNAFFAPLFTRAYAALRDRTVAERVVENIFQRVRSGGNPPNLSEMEVWCDEFVRECAQTTSETPSTEETKKLDPPTSDSSTLTGRGLKTINTIWEKRIQTIPEFEEEKLKPGKKDYASFLFSLAVHCALILFFFITFKALPVTEENPLNLVFDSGFADDARKNEKDSLLDKDMETVLESDVSDVEPDPMSELSDLPIENLDVSAENPSLTSSFDSPAAHIRSGPNAMLGTVGQRTNAEKKKKLLLANGGDGSTMEAVEAALKWLADHQSKKGNWDTWRYVDLDKNNSAKESSSGFMLQTSQGLDDQKEDVYSPGITGLALLAFLGDGHTPERGTYCETVRNGLNYLLSIQKDGAFRSPGKEGRTWPGIAYSHIIATMAMCEAHMMTGNRAYRKSAQQGLEVIETTQYADGGWRYDIIDLKGKHLYSGHDSQWGATGDASLVGWAALPLKIAKTTGLDYSQKTVDKLLQFMENRTQNSSGRVSYKTGLSSINLPECPVAISMVCSAYFKLDSQMDSSERKSLTTLLNRQANLLLEQMPTTPTGNSGRNTSPHVDFYYWYYGQMAMFQIGGSKWTDWNNALKRALIESQIKEGAQKGSWDLDHWGNALAGRVYTTALGALSLEVYYRYPRVGALPSPKN